MAFWGLQLLRLLNECGLSLLSLWSLNFSLCKMRMVDKGMAGQEWLLCTPLGQ